jgi:histone chaperone ASF1
VGSAQDASRDQTLDEILVGPIPVGVNKFVLQADAPDPAQLSPEDLLGVTVVLVTCSYKEREFVRVGYYVNNEYHDPNAPPPVPKPAVAEEGGEDAEEAEAPPLNIPNPIPLEYIQRQILADKPRVTKFPIPWGEPEEEKQTSTVTASGVMDMQEESNASFPNTNSHQGVQAMME